MLGLSLFLRHQLTRSVYRWPSPFRDGMIFVHFLSSRSVRTLVCDPGVPVKVLPTEGNNNYALHEGTWGAFRRTIHTKGFFLKINFRHFHYNIYIQVYISINTYYVNLRHAQFERIRSSLCARSYARKRVPVRIYQ